MVNCLIETLIIIIFKLLAVLLSYLSHSVTIGHNNYQHYHHQHPGVSGKFLVPIMTLSDWVSDLELSIFIIFCFDIKPWPMRFILGPWLHWTWETQPSELDLCFFVPRFTYLTPAQRNTMALHSHTSVHVGKSESLIQVWIWENFLCR